MTTEPGTQESEKALETLADYCHEAARLTMDDPPTASRAASTLLDVESDVRAVLQALRTQHAKAQETDPE